MNNRKEFINITGIGYDCCRYWRIIIIIRVGISTIGTTCSSMI